MRWTWVKTIHTHRRMKMNEEELDILDNVLYIDGVPYNYKVMLLDILTREGADPTTKENEDD